MDSRLKVMLLVAGLAILATVVTGGAVFAQAETVGGATESLGLIGVGAGLAIGLAGLGAGIGLGIGVAAIAGAGAEKPEIMSKSFIFVVFIEAIAIYGLIVSFFIILMLPSA
jgi:V/A-type H+-transporting ATPase subunit K